MFGPMIALRERQLEIARQYPKGEYVVLAGEEVIAHTPSRKDAFDAYNLAAIAERNPVILPPDSRQTPVPGVQRGRTLAGER